MSTHNIEKLSELTLSLSSIISQSSYFLANTNNFEAHHFDTMIMPVILPYFESNEFLDNMIQNYIVIRFKKFEEEILALLKMHPTDRQLSHEITKLEFEIKEGLAIWREKYGPIIEKKFLESSVGSAPLMRPPKI